MIISVIDNLEGKIEPLSYSDAAKVAALIKQSTQDANRGEYAPPDLERLNAFAKPEKIQEEVSKGYLVTLSDDTGGLIGCGMVVRRGSHLVIRALEVKTNYGRKGYGSLLYKYCEKRLKEAGMNEIEVEVPKFPKSEMFYRKHGFVTTGNPTQEGLYFGMFKYF
ncbi:MAG: GNAT family N-acetyltransferase [Desulfobacterales bacterium]|jgi:GNAT superfamily N-acetyltransferase